MTDSQLDQSHDGVGMTSLRSRNRLLVELQGQGIENQIVLEGIQQTPRHIFVDSAVSHRAYENVALPIGWQQTISQPYTVAKITSIVVETLDKILGKRSKVLEIGAGCGYQSAILARIFKQVYAVERIKSLYEKATQNINKLELDNITFSYKDGYEGWEEYAPFDAIVISAATAELPEKLIAQLNSPACLVLPLGGSDNQTLTSITSVAGEIKRFRYDQVVFVPMIEGVKDANPNEK